MRISDWSSDVCSSDLAVSPARQRGGAGPRTPGRGCGRAPRTGRIGASRAGCQIGDTGAAAWHRPCRASGKGCAGRVRWRCPDPLWRCSAGDHGHHAADAGPAARGGQPGGGGAWLPPADPLAYGRVIAGPDGIIEKMVEFKDATDAERAVDLCNSGLMAVRSTDLFGLLARVGNSNAAGEYYLPDIVMIDRKSVV